MLLIIKGLLYMLNIIFMFQKQLSLFYKIRSKITFTQLVHILRLPISTEINFIVFMFYMLIIQELKLKLFFWNLEVILRTTGQNQTCLHSFESHISGWIQKQYEKKDKFSSNLRQSYFVYFYFLFLHSISAWRDSYNYRRYSN